ncbi:phosphate acyltransferase PlsX [Stutzerimonas zhaodongensis]|uniref:Phosphate acyltransferase n=1 Tax=Stutzerimonas zhaodongensis TaxID=1176257 RepID=A0A3M2HQV2_9GAMM|nr:phosphate acyltransferase PlsX [Stutzerimonas zhaodongensis]MCQ4317513.1 phosphate acyltransferase PlsX [Stutzerimonas zhaodongensis]RMH89980.1 phosphate acyltransferase PlsX [Stutzerimonas zhaodongensis]
MSAPVIAIDAMGGDFGPHCIVPASLRCLAETPSLHLALVGQSSILKEIIALIPGVDYSRLQIVDADEVIGMDERPAQVLRSKPRASMRLALELVRDGKAQACVSAGNTGALMALARQILKTLPGVDRPAMMTAIPTLEGPCLLLDLGANVDCTAEQLYQFAVMGSVAAQSFGIDQPRVSLLNIGTEEIKGNQQVKAAAGLLQRADINYQGFIEGDGLFRGETDVAVCDGFVGNILLKSSEGLAHMVAVRVEALFRRSVVSRLVGVLALPLLRQLRSDLRPARYNGASFLGLQGIVVKSHGGAGAEGFRSAILRAATDLEHNLPQRLHSQLEHLLVTGRSINAGDDVTTGGRSPSN